MHPSDFASDWDAAMRSGDYPRAWRINDAVLGGRDPTSRDSAGTAYHQRWVWDGTAVDGREVLVRCYHGLGDTLQYARFLPALVARAAAVTVEAQPELVHILRPLAPTVPFDMAHPRPQSACDVEIMELSHVLRLGPGEAPAAYLAGSALDRAGGIGLCWRAGGWDAARSLPLDQLRAALPAKPLVSLQRGPAASEAREGFRNPGDDDADIARTAALIAGCRQVVTVDSMVAHLAGALGHPACVLLKHHADWRWETGSRSGWYPALRLFRQHRPGDWSAALAELSTWLRAED